MEMCQRCHSQEDLITIPIEPGDDKDVIMITLCKKCVLNGFKGVLEELMASEYHLANHEGETIDMGNALNNIIQSIPVVKRR